jgi:hypothetical protein
MIRIDLSGSPDLGNAYGVWMEPETRERFCLIIDEIKKYEGFQYLTKIG